MGYTLTIGELAIETDYHATQDDVGIKFYAKSERHDDAPAFGEPTDHTNSRWPSCSTWAAFAADSGLEYALYFDGELVGGHPGIRLVTTSLCNAVEVALDNFRTANPTAVARLGGTLADGTLARLVWLDYWCRWARKNCATPIIENS